MRINLRRLSFLGPLTALALSTVVGCQEPIDPDAMSTEAADRAAEIVSSASRAQASSNPAYDDATRTLNGATFVQMLMPGMGSSAGNPMAHQQRGTVVASPAVTALATRLSAAVPAMNDDAAWGDQVRTLIRDRLLTAGNLESKTNDEAIYLLNPGLTCRRLDTGVPIDDCARVLSKIELRIRMTRSGDGTELALLVGPNRVQPGSLLVTVNELAVTSSLGELKKAAALLATATGTTDNTPATMAGTVRLSLRRDGVKQVTFTASILERLELVDQAAGTLFRSAVANPALSLGVDGERRTVAGKIALGPTEIDTPWKPEDKTIGSDRLHIVVAGLTGQATLDVANPHLLDLTNVGLGQGPSFAEVRGHRIFQLDLNAMNERTFDLNIQVAADGTPSVRVSPRFDLAMMWNLAAVAGDFTTPPPSFLLDETYHLALDPVGAQAPRLTRNAAAPDALAVAAGTLTLSSTKSTTTVHAEAGQCISVGPVAPGEHPILGALKVNACP